MTTTRPLDPKQTETAARWVGYVLKYGVKGSLRFYESDGDQLYAEAACAHHRALIEFLVGRGRRDPRDIHPQDLDSSWPKLGLPSEVADLFIVTPPDPKELRGRLDVIDKWLAHLSLDRISSPNFHQLIAHDYSVTSIQLTAAACVLARRAGVESPAGAALVTLCLDSIDLLEADRHHRLWAQALFGDARFSVLRGICGESAKRTDIDTC
jgi:hypothetical protein